MEAAKNIETLLQGVTVVKLLVICYMISFDQQVIKNLEAINVFLKGMQMKHSGILEKKHSFPSKIKMIIISVTDCFAIMYVTGMRRNVEDIVFLGPGLPNYLSFLKREMIDRKVVYINTHHTKTLSDFEGVKIYNIGILAGVIGRLFNRKRKIERLLAINNSIYAFIASVLNVSKVYIPCYYDPAGMSLILDDKRDYKIIEVQHGGIVNFYPYTTPVTYQLVDEIYVDNLRTLKYLEKNLYREVPVIISLKEKERNLPIQVNSEQRPILLLYCSSIEVKGIHPVMMEFLLKIRTGFKFLIRLHPREKALKQVFDEQLSEKGILFEFDDTEIWLRYVKTYKVIVISPWSSVIEEACENDVMSIIIDTLGKMRFEDLIDNRVCFYSQNLIDLFESKKLLDEAI